MTYWEQLKERQEVVERVEIHKELATYINKYKIVLDNLLDENTTYIDFINKSLLYSLLGKKSPVYVSQSPLQLSGEFTQKEFVKEMKNIPIVLMPVDTENYRSSNSLDGIANVYRYYKVAEYIYQNYVPLCKYDSDYAVWCLAEQYEMYKNKIAGLVDGTEYTHKLTEVKSLELGRVKLITKGDATVVVSTGADPIITELQRMIDTSPFINQKMLISIVYKTDQPGPMQLFYTTEQGEKYTGQKVITADISGNGIAHFSVPITEYSRLRLDTPENSTVTIISLKVKHPCTYIDYGYDGPIESSETNIDHSYEYTGALHQYNIRQLPWIWAEYDKKNANDNEVSANLTYDSGKKLYMLDSDHLEIDENGNYLKISATYDGTDTGGLYNNDDELLDATVILGCNQGDQFIEKCRYTMRFKEGTYDYLIRCSADYYWYLRDVNAVKIQTDGFLHNVEMQILKGD